MERIPEPRKSRKETCEQHKRLVARLEQEFNEKGSLGDMEQFGGQTTTYQGEGLLDPETMKTFADELIKHSGVESPEGIVPLLFFFADRSLEKKPVLTREQVTQIEGRNPEELSEEEKFIQDLHTMDLRDIRNLLSGRGMCSGVAGILFSLLRSQDIPCAIFCDEDDPSGHWYIKARVGGRWVHLGYSEGLLADPDSEIFKRYWKQLTWTMPEREVKKLIQFKANGMFKFGVFDRVPGQKFRQKLLRWYRKAVEEMDAERISPGYFQGLREIREGPESFEEKLNMLRELKEFYPVRDPKDAYRFLRGSQPAQEENARELNKRDKTKTINNG